jgi:hypothetical protein
MHELTVSRMTLMFVRGESAVLYSIREKPVSIPAESIDVEAGLDLEMDSE